MKINWCKLLGHRWIIVYIAKTGKFKFIATYCQRCRLGKDELHDAIDKLKTNINTYEIKYFLDPH